MLKIFDKSHNAIGHIVKYKDCRTESEVSSGDKTLSFVYLAKHHALENEMYVQTKDDEYVIKEISESSDGFPEIVAALNLEELQQKMWQTFSVKDSTIDEAARIVLAGTGWTIGECDVTKRRNAGMIQVSSLGVIQNLCTAFMCEPVFDTINKTVSFYAQRGEDKGVYFMQGLNLKKLQKKSTSYDYYTQIIPIGENGLTIENVNDGKNYLENYQYSKKVISYLWKDESYTDPQALKEDAELKLADLSKPEISYSADIIDLARQKPEYGILSFGLGDTITLIDRGTGTREKQRIKKLIEYEKNTEKNTCELANTILTFEELQQKYQNAADIINYTVAGDGRYTGTINVSDILNFESGVSGSSTVAGINGNIISLQGDLAQVKLTLGQVETNYLKTEDADIKYATIAQLDVTNETVHSIQGDYADFKTLTSQELSSQKATIDELLSTQITAEYLHSNYATIDLANISAGTIKSAMIDTGAIGTAQIADGSITSAKIVELTANKVTSGILSVERLEIRGSTNSIVYALNDITGALQAQNVDTLNGEILTPRSITADKIVADSITGNEIASKTITANNIVANSITGDEIVSDTIDSRHIKAHSITAAQILAGSITGNEIAAETITGNNIASNTITANNIVSYSITGTEIASNTIDTRHLKANCITADKIDVTDLFAQDITATGTITGATLIGGTINGAYGKFCGTLSIKDDDGHSMRIDSNGNVHLVDASSDTGSTSLIQVMKGDRSSVISPYTIKVENNNSTDTDCGRTSIGPKSVSIVNIDGSIIADYEDDGIYFNQTEANGFTQGIIPESDGTIRFYTQNGAHDYALKNGWFYSYGSNGWYNATYAGGWYMTDTSWLRSYNSKSIYIGTGKYATSNHSCSYLQALQGSAALNVDSAGASSGFNALGTVRAASGAYSLGVLNKDNTFRLVYGTESVVTGSTNTASQVWTFDVNGGFTCSGNINAGTVTTYSGNYKPVGSYATDGKRVNCLAALDNSEVKIWGQWDVAGAGYSSKVIKVTTSDIRLKTNIMDTEIHALDTINRIQMRQFDWISNARHQAIGFIADELELLDSGFSFGGGYNEDGTMDAKGVDDFYVLGYAIKGIQEICAIDDAQNDRLNLVESRQMIQDARIEFLQNQLMEARAHIARQDAEIARLSGLLEGAA